MDNEMKNDGVKITRDTVLTKADLEMAVFLSQGEVDRYRIILDHDIRAAELMDPDIATCETVQMPWSGLIGAEMTVNVPNAFVDMIPHVDDAQDVTGETGTLYRAPVV